MFEKIRSAFLKNLGIGLLTLIPLFGTFYVIVWLWNLSDNFLFNLLPLEWRPYELFGFHIPGLGILLTVFIICVAGLLARNFLGKQLYALVERVIKRVPVMNSMYAAFRQLTESIFMDRSQAFRKVVMIEYPRAGCYTIAFVTGISKNTTKKKDAYAEMYSVFVPTTPNPTSGFFLVLPDWGVYDLDMTVQEAFRLIVSGGLLAAQGDALARMEKSILPSVEARKKEQ